MSLTSTVISLFGMAYFFRYGKYQCNCTMPSSVVAAIKYDASSSTLRVTYVSGMIYDYKNIPEEVYTAMKASFSKGVFLNQHIKGKYAYEKIKV